MVIYIGADHRGFSLKESLIAYLRNQGYEVMDMGNAEYDETDDYPVFAAAVAQKISANPEQGRGILICGSGVGVNVVANKFRRVRSVLGCSPDHIFDGRHDEDVNVVSLAADFTSEAEAQKMIQVFMSTEFAGEERFVRRLEEISNLENIT